MTPLPFFSKGPFTFLISNLISPLAYFSNPSKELPSPYYSVLLSTNRIPEKLATQLALVYEFMFNKSILREPASRTRLHGLFCSTRQNMRDVSKCAIGISTSLIVVL